MLSSLNSALTRRQILLPLPILLSLVASILAGGVAPPAFAAAAGPSACRMNETQHFICAHKHKKKQGGDPVNYWATSGTQIINPSGTPFTITGINWYGFETTNNVAGGLDGQDYTTIVDEIKTNGYNTIRIPFSDDLWEHNPTPSATGGCSCKGMHSLEILTLIINRANNDGLHIILDNHRSEAGSSAESNGLWYTSSYPESKWITDWQQIQQWANGNLIPPGDSTQVNPTEIDGSPVILGFDLRNEPHTPSSRYLAGATWGTGDGIAPNTNPNPNPFAPTCVTSSTCHDWRLAAERAADTLFSDADKNTWPRPLIFVEGISQYPQPGGNARRGVFDYTWWGGDLQGVNGNSTNPGAPIVLNAGGNAASLGPAVNNHLVYSAHDYGPSVFGQGWFNNYTCYAKGCTSPSASTLSSLADVWNKFWAYINVPNGVNPAPASGQSSYPWDPYHTGVQAYSQAPIWIGEFGTGNNTNPSDLISTGAGSQGQWFTDLVNFIQSSYASNPSTAPNYSGYMVTNLHWTYWALNSEDSLALLDGVRGTPTWYTGLANPDKEDKFLCTIQQGPFAIPSGLGIGQCNVTAPPTPS